MFSAIPSMDTRKYSILHDTVAHCHIKIYILVEYTGYDSIHCSRLAFLSKFCNVSMTKTKMLPSPAQVQNCRIPKFQKMNTESALAGTKNVIRAQKIEE